MKPLTIKVGTLAKVGLGIAAIELAADIGKASMFTVVKIVNSEAADQILESLDASINSNRYRSLRKCKLKIVRGMCKAFIKD